MPKSSARATPRLAGPLEGRLPTDCGRRGHIEMAAQDVCVKGNIGTQDRAHDVVFLCDPWVGAVFDPNNLPLPYHDAFGKEKAGGEFEIVPRGAHRDGERCRGSVTLLSRLDPNFHRLLGGNDIGFLHGEIASDLPNLRSSRWARSVHAFPFAAAAAAAAGAIRTSAL